MFTCTDYLAFVPAIHKGVLPITRDMHARWWLIDGQGLGHALQVRPIVAQFIHADKIG
jgi:hypothetical protein